MKVIFICSGNTCRSPMAQGIFKKLTDEMGISCECGSAGVAAFAGSTATAEALEAAKELGVDISSHRSRQLSQYMLDEKDTLFVTMTQQQAVLLKTIIPEDRVRLLGDGIFDPYGGTLDDYRRCAAEIKKGVEALICSLFPVKIERMNCDSVKAVFEIEKLSFSVPWSLESLTQELSNENAVYYTAALGEEIVGYIGVIAVMGEAGITTIAVLPEFRHRGIASLLLERMISDGKEKGWEFLTLEVRAGNSAAISLYQKYGFAEVGRRRNYYTAPIEDAILMTLTFQKDENQ